MEIDDDRPTYTIFFSVIHILLCKNISRSPSRGMEEKSVQQIDYFILKPSIVCVCAVLASYSYAWQNERQIFDAQISQINRLGFPAQLYFNFSRRRLALWMNQLLFQQKYNPVRIIIFFWLLQNRIKSSGIKKEREKKRFSFPFCVVDDDSHHRVPLSYQKIKANKLQQTTTTLHKRLFKFDTFQFDGGGGGSDGKSVERWWYITRWKSQYKSSVEIIITLNVEFDRVLECGAGDEGVFRSTRHVGAVVMRLRRHHQAAHGHIAIFGILFHESQQQ